MGYKVYEGYYEMYITQRELNSGRVYLVAEFDTMREAEDYVKYREMWLNIDRDLISESQYDWSGDDLDNHIFDVECYGNIFI